MIVKLTLRSLVIATCVVSPLGIAQARTIPASPVNALVVEYNVTASDNGPTYCSASGGSVTQPTCQACLDNSYETTTSVCALPISVDFVGIPVDSAGTKNFNFTLHVPSTSVGFTGCEPVGADNTSDSFWFYGHVSCPAGTTCTASTSTYVPAHGYNYVSCTLEQGTTIDAIELTNP